jgi:uncharacterized protein YjbJ (UPF0337 family)
MALPVNSICPGRMRFLSLILQEWRLDCTFIPRNSQQARDALTRLFVNGIRREGAQIATAAPHANVHLKEIAMNSSMKDKTEGTLHQMKGAIKEKVGQVTDNPKLTTEGHVEKVAGIVQEKIGEIKAVLDK